MMKKSRVRKLIKKWEKLAKDAALARDIGAWGTYCDWIFAAELILRRLRRATSLGTDSVRHARHRGNPAPAFGGPTKR